MRPKHVVRLAFRASAGFFTLLPLAAAAQHGPPAAVAERIARVERGLLPRVALAGQPVPRYTMEERMRVLRVPGVSVAVLHDGKVEWARGYGVRRTGSSEPVDSTTLFQAASISKPVAAVAALRLVEKGRLTLDSDINTVLTTWRVPDTTYTANEKVTLRRLLSHSAGLTVHGFPGYAAGAAVPTVEQILDGAKPANTAAVRVNVAPGTLWRYSGGGFTVMQLALTTLTEKDFPALMRELVLAPAGMTSSGYEQPLPETKHRQAAVAHRGDGSAIPGNWHSYPEMAAAGLWTTPSDLLLFARAIQHSLGGEPGALLSQKTARDFVTIQKGTYGLGVGVEGEGSSTRFSHGGANAGYRCLFFAFTQRGDGVAVMTNSDNGSELTAEIARAVADVYGWNVMQPQMRQTVEVDVAKLRSVAGNYRLVINQDTLSLVMRLDGPALMAEMKELSREPIRLYASAADRFFSLTAPGEFAVQRDAAGAAIAVQILGIGVPARAVRLP